MPDKPLGIKAYGHIAHLPGSRLGPGDHRVDDGQARIATLKVRDRHDLVIVQEKLDGSCVAVGCVEGVVTPLIRAGYRALDSHYEQHRMFAAWVFADTSRFDWLEEGERVVGEWLAQAHGTRYDLKHDPFVAFDLMTAHRRATLAEFEQRVPSHICRPCVIHRAGESLSVEAAMKKLHPGGFHGAIDPIEGAVWRVERKGEVDFLAKHVRPDKIDGCYLPEISGGAPIWNWRPT